MDEFVLKIIFVILIIIQLIYNNKKYYSNKDKREKVTQLEFIQRILNMEVNGQYELSKDLTNKE